jgi:hypothetical protein
MMRHAANKPVSPALGIFSPLRYAVFRRIWTASLLSNLGLLVLGRRRLGDDEDLVIDRYGGAGPCIVDAAGPFSWWVSDRSPGRGLSLAKSIVLLPF